MPERLTISPQTLRCLPVELGLEVDTRKESGPSLLTQSKRFAILSALTLGSIYLGAQSTDWVSSTLAQADKLPNVSLLMSQSEVAKLLVESLANKNDQLYHNFIDVGRVTGWIGGHAVYFSIAKKLSL